VGEEVLGEDEYAVENIVVVTVAVDPEILKVTVGSGIGTMMVVKTKPAIGMLLVSYDTVAGIVTTLENMVSLRSNAGAVGTGSDESSISVTTDLLQIVE
jgi:hypothetical protein